jgi:hypothetical protein
MNIDSITDINILKRLLKEYLTECKKDYLNNFRKGEYYSCSYTADWGYYYCRDDEDNVVIMDDQEYDEYFN